MATDAITEASLKQALREALVEVLQEQRELFHEVIVEALEDFALTKAIKAGKKTKAVSSEEILKVLRGKG